MPTIIEMYVYRKASLGLVLALSLGCTSTDPVRVEQDFGSSVRNMVQQQTYDPTAAVNPTAEPPMSYDGYKAKRTLETYRGDIAHPEEAEVTPLLNIIQ